MPEEAFLCYLAAGSCVQGAEVPVGLTGRTSGRCTCRMQAQWPAVYPFVRFWDSSMYKKMLTLWMSKVHHIQGLAAGRE